MVSSDPKSIFWELTGVLGINGGRTGTRGKGLHRWQSWSSCCPVIIPSVLLSGDVAQDNVLQSLSPSAHWPGVALSANYCLPQAWGILDEGWRMNWYIGRVFMVLEGTLSILQKTGIINIILQQQHRYYGSNQPCLFCFEAHSMEWNPYLTLLKGTRTWE